MLRRFMVSLSLFACVLSSTGPTHGAAPGSIEVTCDVDRKAFRSATSGQTDVTFRIWSAQTGGTECDNRAVALNQLVVFKAKTDHFDGVSVRSFAQLKAVIGSDATPIQLCSGTESWLDVTVGVQTLTCDFSSQPPAARRRLHAVAFASQGAGGGTVSEVDSGAGLQGGPITTSGTLSVNAPACSAAADKLLWNGSAFQCGTDQTDASNTGSLGTFNVNQQYQNSSARKIIVVAYGDSNGDGYYLRGFTGTASASTLVAQDRWRGASITFVVPPGYFWEVTQTENGSPRIEAWEL
jgi:hypothetical protein